VSVVERTVGLGSHVGIDSRGPFQVAELKALRLEAVVSYQTWARSPSEVEQAIQELIARLLGDRDRLRTNGFLRLALKNTGPSENVFSEDAWRQSVSFEVLYEFPYQDADDVLSLIAQIPIQNEGEVTENILITDEMARWDNESAQALLLRGRLSIGTLSALAFIPGTATPAGSVSITRTFDGASGAPTNHLTLQSFLAAVTGDNPASLHAQLTFPSLKDFLGTLANFKITGDSLAELKVEGVPDAVLAQLLTIKDKEFSEQENFITVLKATIGDAQTETFKKQILAQAANPRPVALGDWDDDKIPDRYESLGRTIEPPIKLPSIADRLEIVYEMTPSLTDFAVVYLRATR
jgi:hypothetical protein